MKKYFLYLAAVAAAIVAASCSKVENSSAPGVESDVTFVISTPDIATRAVGDGTTAKDLYYGVYAVSEDVNQNIKHELMSEISKVTIGDPQKIELQTSVSLKLVNGKTYALLFWAESADAKYTLANSNDEKRICTVDWNALSMSYDPQDANQERYDAFYAYVEPFKVTGAITQEVKLYRPFAQLNIGTDDTEEAKAAGMEVSHTEVIVHDVYSKMSLIDGSVAETDKVDVTYKSFSVSGLANEKFPYPNNKYLSMNYLLVNDKKDLTVVELNFKGSDGMDYKREFTFVPVQRNYRTNIVGSILTDEADYTVIIKPDFADEQYDREFPEVKTAAELLDVMTNGGTATLQNDITVDANSFQTKADGPKGITIPEGSHVIVDLNGYTLSNEIEDIFIRVSKDAVLEFKGVKSGSKVTSVHYIASANVSGVIKVNGGEYEAVTTAFQANGGKVYITDGSIQAEPYQGSYKYTLNHIDKQYQEDYILVSGGKFYKYDPSHSDSENPQASFVADGYRVEQEGDWYYVVEDDATLVASEAEIEGAFSTAGANVVLADDMAITKTIAISAPGVLDGNGNSVSGTLTDYSTPAINSVGGTIKNLSIVSGCMYSIASDNLIQDLYIDNVKTDKTGYGLNMRGNGTKYSIYVSNSTFLGWSSMTGLKDANFDKCHFGQGEYWVNNGYSDVYDRILKPYVKTVFRNCSFEKGFYIDLSSFSGASIEFINCTVDGEALTKDMFKNLTESTSGDCTSEELGDKMLWYEDNTAGAWAAKVTVK